MSNYNFKDLFSETAPIHNTEYVTNKHILFKKTLLSKSRLDYINTFPMDEKLIQQLAQTIENESKKPIITEFIPQLVSEDNESNTLIMELDRGYKGCNESISKIYPAIQERYYNFIISLKCKIYLVNNDQVNPLSIYNNDNEFVGIVLPLMIKNHIPTEAISYNEYLDKLKTDQKTKELKKENSNKCLYISNNKAIIRNKELISVAELVNDETYKNIYIEKMYPGYNKDAEVYLDLGIVCFYVKSMGGKSSQEDIKYHLCNTTGYTLEMVLDNIYTCKANNQFINVAQIKLLELSGASEDKVKELIDYRQQWYDRKDRENKEKEAKRQQEDKEYIEGKNKIVEELVLAAEHAILNKQEVQNQEVTIYNSKYSSNDTSLILHIMKQYDIKVPLKTQGWINQALSNIVYEEESGKYSYSYYNSSVNSKVFRGYLYQLIDKVNEKYSVGVVAK